MQITAKQGIYLAALLHDIGKFWQRASSSRKVLSQSTLQMESSICPTGTSGFATHIHALFTHEFFENHRNIFPGDFEHNGQRVQLGNLSARHHKRDLNELERIIQYADVLSSGHDRRDESEYHANDTSYKYKKIPLLNPFDVVYQIREPDQRSYYSLRKLAADDTIFASTDIDIESDKQEEYNALWSEFTAELQSLPSVDFSALSTSLLYLLKKYTWCIPSATNVIADISLFDHLKTTAAIASCLYHSEGIADFGKLPPTFGGLEEESKERFALFVGDFSGIQKFIYQLSSKGAAKTLKGRSFYLNLVQDVILNKIKSIFEIQDAHILMASGGRFQVLLPNDSVRLQELNEFVSRVNIELRNEFSESLYLSTGIRTFPANRFMDDNGYSEIVSEAYASVEKDKSRKFSAILDAGFFKAGPVAGAGSEQICHVTGIDLQKSDTRRLDDDTVVSRAVYEQVELGKWLKGASHIVKLYNSNRSNSNQEITPLAGLLNADDTIASYRIYKKGELNEKELRLLKSTAAVSQIITIHSTDFLYHSDTDSSIACSFIFYGAAWIPEMDDGRPVEFTDIAKDGVNNLMAVLRMDVDNLGKLFKEGFNHGDGNNKIFGSISRFSNLSEKLELFFSGYTHHLISEIYNNTDILDDTLTISNFKNKVPNEYILPVYAGGDDVFIISRWDIAPQLANQLNKKFTKFTNGHNSVSLSGGVTMVHGKYPIHKAALEAEEAEHAAKILPANGKPDGKNAFCMFGQAMSWDDFNMASEYVKQVINWQEEMDTRTVLSFLRRLYGEYHEKYHYGRWRWRSAYRLQRIGKSYRQEAKAVTLATDLFSGRFKGKNFSRIEILPKDPYSEINRTPELVDITGFAVRWVQSLTRNKS